MKMTAQEELEEWKQRHFTGMIGVIKMTELISLAREAEREKIQNKILDKDFPDKSRPNYIFFRDLLDWIKGTPSHIYVPKEIGLKKYTDINCQTQICVINNKEQSLLYDSYLGYTVGRIGISENSGKNFYFEKVDKPEVGKLYFVCNKTLTIQEANGKDIGDYEKFIDEKFSALFTPQGSDTMDNLIFGVDIECRDQVLLSYYEIKKVE